MIQAKPIKPLGRPAYGHIPHLPGSRRGPGDHGLEYAQAALLTVKARDKWDHIVVEEKLDGSCVAVAKQLDGRLVALIRRGYLAKDSPFPMHHVFHSWVIAQSDRFSALLWPGERAVGEWLLEAHGTRYHLVHEPFVIFDIFNADNRRLPVAQRNDRCLALDFITPTQLHSGGPLSIEAALDLLGTHGHHGAQDPAEGVVYRMEREGQFDFLAKYVRPDKRDGIYLDQNLWNTFPSNDLPMP